MEIPQDYFLLILDCMEDQTHEYKICIQPIIENKVLNQQRWINVAQKNKALVAMTTINNITQ